MKIGTGEGPSMMQVKGNGIVSMNLTITHPILIYNSYGLLTKEKISNL